MEIKSQTGRQELRDLKIVGFVIVYWFGLGSFPSKDKREKEEGALSERDQESQKYYEKQVEERDWVLSFIEPFAHWLEYYVKVPFLELEITYPRLL